MNFRWHLNLATVSILCIWKKQFEIKGSDALYSKKKVRPSIHPSIHEKEMSKQEKQIPVESSLEVLQEEIDCLRMENEY